ncbi:hypothetical protein BN128_1623 [Cronobacter sakazakii 696]|nr:hypothetical protein BN128_1623 [Cronobacter sakazakii 696]
MRRALKNPLRLTVGVIAAESLEVDRTANDRLVNLRVRLLLSRLANMHHHRADQVFKQRDLLRLQPAGTEKRLRRLHEPDLFRVVHVLAQRAEPELYAARRHVDALFAVIAQRAAQQRLRFRAARLDILMAIQPFAYRLAHRRANHGRQQRRALLKRQHLRHAVTHHRDRTVGGAVVKTDKHSHIPHAVKKGGDFSEMSRRRQME